MTQILLHLEVLDDIKFYKKKGWYLHLSVEIPRICRLLLKNGKMPGESPVHYIKLSILQSKTFHAGINLPKERIGKRKGARTIYVKESNNLIKIIYVGGHKDKRYDNPYAQVKLIEDRYRTESYFPYKDDFNFE